MKTIALLLSLLAVFIAGCPRQDPELPKNVSYYGNVRELTLKDGTRCAVYDEGRGGGISCDWK